MIDPEVIKKNLEKVGRKLSEKERAEREEKFQTRMKEARCPLCQGNFSEEDIQTKKYFTEFSCPPSDNRYFHPDCLELKKEARTNPLLFAKVKRLEEEIKE